MPDDQDEPRDTTTPTEAAPPPSQPENTPITQPPGPADAAAQAVLGTLIPPKMPPNPVARVAASPPDWWENSFFQAIFNDLQAGIAKLSETKEGYDAILRAIGDSHSANETNWGAMRGQLETWRKASEAKDSEQDDRIAALEKQIATLEAAVGSLKQEIVELKNATARPAAAPTAGQIGQQPRDPAAPAASE